jgi:hypothetical protein
MRISKGREPLLHYVQIFSFSQICELECIEPRIFTLTLAKAGGEADAALARPPATRPAVQRAATPARQGAGQCGLAQPGQADQDGLR